MPYFIYILECSNGAYYSGYTTDLVRRYQEHCNGSPKCKYTRSFPPQRVAAFWQVMGDLSLALKVEREIKRLSKSEKMRIINRPRELKNILLVRQYSEGSISLITPFRKKMEPRKASA